MTSREVPAGVEPLASSWHTASVACIVVGLALAGRAAMAHHPTLASASHIQIYLSGLVVQWGLYAFIFLGLRRKVRSARQLIDANRWTLGSLAIYLLLALAGGVVWAFCQNLLGTLLHAGPEQIRRILQAYMPRGAQETALWVVLAVSAGFCEEFIYRGYLLRQFRSWTGSAPFAIVLQALLFGFAHAAMPWQMAVTAACYGVLLGSLAVWKNSLAPGMFLHAGFDLLALAVR